MWDFKFMKISYKKQYKNRTSVTGEVKKPVGLYCGPPQTYAQNSSQQNTKKLSVMLEYWKYICRYKIVVVFFQLTLEITPVWKVVKIKNHTHILYYDTTIFLKNKHNYRSLQERTFEHRVYSVRSFNFQDIFNKFNTLQEPSVAW